MVNAQEWLDKKYPQKSRSETTQIDAKNQNLSGKLTTQDWSNLEKIDCRNNKDLTTIELINLPNLKHFQANNCQIDSINITNCPNLTYFNVGNNFLTKADFLASLNPEKLTYLSIHSNNFAKQKLDFLSQFTNLEELYIDNSNEENFDQRIYNHFYGSLQPLQNLTSLKWLSIAKTDLDSGLEYLPKSLKKIGIKKDWGSDNDSNCAKIIRELEKAAQVQEVTEKLIQSEENEPISVRGKATWYRITPWRQAYDLLGEEEFKKQISQQNAQAWLDKHHPKETTNEREKRENITFLNLNNKNLAGHLDLREFVNLESLSCLGNKLTNLNLSQCKNLVKINCSGNKFTNIDFLKEIPNKGKLEILRINKNEELKENLNFLTFFAGLKELNIEDCPLVGSLEPLKDMKNLRKVFISRTNISRGLEYLPKSCRELYCDYDYQYKSIKIADELSKFAEDRYYDIAKWREDKQNKTISTVIPLERLFVIRSNIKKFINKWGKETEDNWYKRSKKKFLSYWREQQPLESNVNELSNLQSPEEFSVYWYTGGVKWIARAGAVTGGVLALRDYPEIGGALAAAFPFVEVVASRMEEKLYDDKEKKWEEFISDTENFLDNYHELLGILEQIKESKLGVVNEALNDLRVKTKKFLEKYDGDDNGTIDISELTKAKSRESLGEDLAKEKTEGNGSSQLGDIVLTIKALEKEVTGYRQGISGGAIEEINQQNEAENKLEEEIQIITDNQQDEIQAQQEILPKH